jgi:signal transduction histidine kinase
VFARARWRLVGAYTAIIAIVLVTLGGAVFVLFQRNLYADVDGPMQFTARLYAEAYGQNSVYAAGSCWIPPPTVAPRLGESAQDDQLSIIDCNHASVTTSDALYPTGVYPRGVNQALNGITTVVTTKLDSHYWRVFTIPITPRNGERPVGVVQFFRIVDNQVHEQERLAQVLIGGSIAGLILAGVAGFFLAGRTLSPIRVAFDRQRKFIADASHELRTPLTLIRSSAEMVSTSAQNLEPEDAELLEDIVSEVDRMSKLVTDLLTLARVDNSQVVLDVDPVDMAELATQVNQDIEQLAKQKNVAARVHAGEPTLVIGDELRLRQLLLILLDNAVKYTSPGGTIETSVGRENGHVSLTVTDSGVGISQDALPHVFERFYRADGARTHETGGAGLGLSIARWIVQAHHGEIVIQSKPGKGTVVTVDLPVAGKREV